MSWLTPAKRKWLYSVTAAVNALAVAVVPVLVQLGWIDAPAAEQVLQIAGGVLALVSAVVAINFVPGKVDESVGE